VYEAGDSVCARVCLVGGGSRAASAGALQFTCVTGTKLPFARASVLLAVDGRCPLICLLYWYKSTFFARVYLSLRIARSLRRRPPFYLLYWCKSTNAGAEASAVG
jgi:hypothetical protein